MTENEISYEVRGAVFEVYNELGPGLLESVYQAALRQEFLERKLSFAEEVSVPVIYKGKKLKQSYRIDFLVENKLVVELKSVEVLLPVHHKQVLTYLKLINCKLGLLVNFNCNDMAKSIHRKVNKL